MNSLQSLTWLTSIASLCFITLSARITEPPGFSVETTTNPETENSTDGFAEFENETESHSIVVVGWKFDYVSAPLIITAFIIAVTVLKIVYHHLHFLSTLVPESCALILLGIALGSLFLLDPNDKTHDFLIFDQRTFFLVLLPPIILEAAYSLRDRAFLENLGTILLYAVVGTILNIIVISSALVGLKSLGIFGSMQITTPGLLLFSSFIAAVDPVAVLAIFQEVGVNKMLYFMVFGESLLNDGVTVVMYNLMLEYMELDAMTISEVFLGLAAFLCVALGAVAIGFMCGFISAFLTKYTFHIRVLEPTILFGFAYLSYLLAELFHFSGIISIICCGINQAQYAMENISSKSYITVNYFSKVASSVSESLIFIILGVMLVNDRQFLMEWNTVFSVSSLIICILARFLVVYGLTFLVNRFLVGIRRVTMQEQFVMAYGGLRGAISFSLAFMLNPEKVPAHQTLLGATYLIIFFTVFIQGSTIKPLVNLLRIRLVNKESSNNYRLFVEFHRAMVNNLMAGAEEIIGYRGSNYWTSLAKTISQRFVRPAIQKESRPAGRGLVATFQELNALQLGDRESSVGSAGSQTDHLQGLKRLDSIKLPSSVSDAILDSEHATLQGSMDRFSVPLSPGLNRPLSVDSPADILQLRDVAMNSLNRRIHYVSDRNLTDDGNVRLNSLAHLSRVHSAFRLRLWRRRAGTATTAQLLRAALLPVATGLQLDKLQEEEGEGDEMDGVVGRLALQVDDTPSTSFGHVRERSADSGNVRL